MYIIIKKYTSFFYTSWSFFDEDQNEECRLTKFEQFVCLVLEKFAANVKKSA